MNNFFTISVIAKNVIYFRLFSIPRQVQDHITFETVLEVSVK